MSDNNDLSGKMDKNRPKSQKPKKKFGSTSSLRPSSKNKSRSVPTNISKILEYNNAPLSHFVSPDENNEPSSSSSSSRLGKALKNFGFSSVKGKQRDSARNHEEYPTSIPYKKFAETSKVNIFSNNLVFDEKISKLSHVTVLNLTKNAFSTGEGLTTLPPSFVKLRKLKELDLRGNPLNVFPEVIFEIDSLSILNLADCLLSEIPHQVSKLKNLKKLFLENNEIEMNDNILDLPNLKQLALSNNKITDISKLVLNSIENLDIGDNFIEQIPESLLSGGSHLKQLILRGNSIQSLPPSIDKLKSLKWLDISKNRLKKLPSQIGDLSRLRYLNISWNDLTALPESVKNLNEGISLYCGENPLQRPPSEVALDGIKSIQCYFKALNKSTALTSRRMKLMILGNERAGKI